MMRKTCLVWLMVAVCVGFGNMAWGANEVAADKDQLAEGETVEAAPVESADGQQPASSTTGLDMDTKAEALSPREKTRQRIEAIRDLSAAELKEQLAATEAALPALNTQLGEASRAAQETRELAAAESQEIRDLYIQIRALHERIAALTETLPAVQEKVAEQTEIRGNLLGEMDFRTQLIGLIRQKETAAAVATDAKELP